MLDNFDLGLRAMEKAGPVEKGIYLIRSQIEDILKKRGLTKMEIKTGDMFDPATDGSNDGDRERPAARRGGGRDRTRLSIA